MTPTIVFLSDFGLEDEFVGICHAVIARIAPEAIVIDLTHGVPRGDVFQGALLLSRSAPYLPEQAVILGVVDPGVGTRRRAVAVRTVPGHFLVGPDNGLLSLAFAGTGPVEAVEISSPDILLTPVSSTFHGRDVFAPAAAHLAKGGALAELGPRVDPASLVRLSIPPAVIAHELNEVAAAVLIVDHFGNVKLAASVRDLEAAGLGAASAILVSAGGRVSTARRAVTFGDVASGALALIEDSSGWLALVVNGGSASERLGLQPGQTVTLGQDRSQPAR